MSLFGEDDTDKRNHNMALAGFLAGTHALRILAERGIATPDDIITSNAGIIALIDMIPAGQLAPGTRDKVVEMLENIVAEARRNCTAPGERP
ncbi:MAG: hypothetical protein V4579_01150 [Pseudomonadota bacterium]